MLVAVGKLFAKVDEADFEEVNRRTWYLCNGYARTDIWEAGKRRHVYMHRMILGTELHVDHKNGDKLDNQRDNLRPVTRSQNLQNRRGATKQSATRTRGVYVDKRDGAIYARCVVNGKSVNLGRFPSIDKANEAVAFARSSLMTHSPECGRIA